MSSLKNKIINGIIDREVGIVQPGEDEGGYTNNPNDSGGETRWGITEKVARAYGYTGAMKDLPRDMAFTIYTDKYWNSIHGDDIVALSEAIANELADTGVNMGIDRAGQFLQRSLNVFNQRGKLYPDVTVDGNIGPASVAALKQYLATRKEVVMLRALNSLQGEFYIADGENRPKDEDFEYGWFMNRVVI